MSKNRVEMEKRIRQPPGWLWPTSNTLPGVYKKIWEGVKEDRLKVGPMNGEVLVDTNKVFPLLLTSQLPTEVLGYIWSLANQKYAGQLTEQELYTVLALIAVAQTSYPFSSIDVLYMLPGAPIPRLNLDVLFPNIHQNSSPVLLESNNHGEKFSSHQPTKIIPSSIINSNQIVDSKADIKSSRSVIDDKLRKENVDDFNDDFTEFQSAPIPSTTTNIPLWDSKKGSAIGSRLANHNLSNGMSFIDKKKNNSGKNHYETDPIRLSPINNPGILAKEKSYEPSGSAFPKCVIKNQAKTVILKDTAIRNDPPAVSTSHPRENNVNKLSEPSSGVKLVKPVVSNAIKSPEVIQTDLMNLQPVEDKYSALRNLIEEPISSVLNPVVESPIPAKSPEPFDDFGDFVSAEQIDSTLVSSFDTTLATPVPSFDTSLDLFSDFEKFLPNCNDKSEISFVQETIEAFAQLEITASPEKTINFLEEKYEVTIDPEKVIQKDDAISLNSIELNNGPTNLTRSGSVPSLDLKSFLPPALDDDKESEHMHQLIYWEWKQYMEVCVLLLQVAADIFTKITSESVLQEVLNSAQGYNFLCNLAEVAAVCRRVNFSHKEMDINIMGFDDLLMEIDKIWAEMEPFYTNIPIVTELPVWPGQQTDGSCCALCLTVVTSGKTIHNDSVYHLTCANLWLNCVSSNLPILRYTSVHGN